METLRKPLQGITNIVRFNWHFYLLAFAMGAVLYFCGKLLAAPLSTISYAALVMVVVTTAISLGVSLYIYDLSGLYELRWLNHLPVRANQVMVNINAGFEETSELLHGKFPEAQLIVFDFYDPLKHTEVSIERARKAYPPFKGTVTVNTTILPLPDSYADHLFLIFAAHEIRDDKERITFFKELKRVLKPNGNLMVIEHLRDNWNFLAYNIGAYHFLPVNTWHSTFDNAGLHLAGQEKITPFITKFMLTKYGSKS